MPVKKTKEEGRRERRENALFEVKKLIPREGLHRARNLPETQKICIQAIKFRQKMINRIIEALEKLSIECVVAPYEANARFAYMC